VAVDISVVIPAFNEARCLPRLLATVTEAARRYRRGAEQSTITSRLVRASSG
jgi:hypothetical protein